MGPQAPWLPRRRSDELLAEQVGNEVVVLDLRSGEAHCLTGVAAALWELCDGTHGVGRLAALAEVSDDWVDAMLAELCGLGLLEPSNPEHHRITRRGVARRALQAGAAGLVFTAALPAVAAALSGKTANCVADSSCPGGFAGGYNSDPACASGVCYRYPGGIFGPGAAYCVKSGCTPPGGGCTRTTDCCFGSCVQVLFLGFCTGIGCNP